MTKHIKEYKGIAVGDIVKLDSKCYPKFKRAKVKDIYQEGDAVRYIVKISNGEVLDIDKTNIALNNEACCCEITVLLRRGCQCGGY